MSPHERLNKHADLFSVSGSPQSLYSPVEPSEDLLLVIRLSTPVLKTRILAEAKRKRLSLNAWIEQALRKQLGTASVPENFHNNLPCHKCHTHGARWFDRQLLCAKCLQKALRKLASEIHL